MINKNVIAIWLENDILLMKVFIEIIAKIVILIILSSLFAMKAGK